MRPEDVGMTDVEERLNALREQVRLSPTSLACKQALINGLEYALSQAGVWTKEKPKEGGWYWYCGDPELNGNIGWVSDDCRVVLFPSYSHFINDLEGYWCGPIIPPVEP